MPHSGQRNVKSEDDICACMDLGHSHRNLILARTSYNPERSLRRDPKPAHGARPLKTRSITQQRNRCSAAAAL